MKLNKVYSKDTELNRIQDNIQTAFNNSMFINAYTITQTFTANVAIPINIPQKIQYFLICGKLQAGDVYQVSRTDTTITLKATATGTYNILFF